eukprot:Nitzschia sp. Nitz4//scaffold69_size99277//74796//75311//NITZ4_004644-RA/size99277-processed-gene-0.67-mRNA-1//1//CDS//3329556748//3835//frame0
MISQVQEESLCFVKRKVQEFDAELVVVQPRKRQRQGSVRMSETVSEVSSTRSSSDIQESWYTPQEYRSFIIDCARTMKTMKALNDDTEKLEQYNTCMRGLEYQYDKKMGGATKGKRAALIRAVLVQQQKNRALGVTDTDSLRLVSESMSAEAKAVGNSRGQSDFEVQLDCY